jgi:hypothetical protein
MNPKMVFIVKHFLVSEGLMGRNGERVVLKSYSTELFELPNSTLKLLSSKPYNEYENGLEQGLNH